MLDELDSYEQFLEWRAYDELDPFGEERMDIRVADVVRTLVNINRGKHAPFTIDQTMLYFGDHTRGAPRQQSWQEMKAVGQQVFALIGDGKSQAV